MRPFAAIRPCRRRAVSVAIACACAAVGAPPALAQDAAPGTVTAAASLTGVAQFDTDLDGGGRFRWSGAFASASLARQVTKELEVGVNVRYDYQDWRFDAPSRFGGQAPWGRLQTPTLGIDIDFTLASGLDLGLSPTVGGSYENGAKTGDAVTWGLIATATQFFSQDLVLGLGAGIFRQIEETRVYPFVVVNWRINDKLRLANPFPAGPAGGAGLELAYALDERWEIAAGGSYRSYRFRLKDSGANAGGVGENSFFPLFARVRWKLAPKTNLDLYAAAFVGGELKLMDASGNNRASDNYRTAPAAGLTLAQRF
jgi:hypothetical protein